MSDETPYEAHSNGPPDGSSNGSPNGGVFTWFMATAVLAVLALVVGVIALFSPNGETSDTAVGEGGEVTIDVTLGEMFIEVSETEVPLGSTITFVVTNDGTMQHDFKIDGSTGTAMLNPGATETFEYGPVEGPVNAWCTVPGHKEAGMETTIGVAGGSGEKATDSASESAAAGEGDFAEIDPNGEPSEDWVPRDPKLPPAPEGTVHEVTFNMVDKVTEVAPGVTQDLWTFEGTTPGPTLRGKVGDKFIVTIVNQTDMDHSIDFHASEVAPNVEMRDIGPGEELVYEFTAEYAGAWMYHCGTAPTLHHIGNGMYGAVVIDPPELAPVDHEFLFVQSEFYFGPEGGIGDLTKMQNEDWDAVVFNGYFNQYVFSPIKVGVNDRVRVWVIDDGPSENSSFHIVGTIFDTTFKEGAYLLRPDASRGGSQALDLQPAQGGFVEFDLDNEGYYTAVTHKFANVGKGAAGVFVAGNPPPR
ncbi:MAG: multicopper oxidase domain-containing protein [Microthrixaceae bacterium]|nr:multicopper oxidase domain-containing protein [Microthrixaceae bacterium]